MRITICSILPKSQPELRGRKAYLINEVKAKSVKCRYSKGHMVPPSVCNIFGSTSSVPPFRLPRFWINIIPCPLLFEMLLDRRHSVPFFRFVIFLDRCHSVPPFPLRNFWTDIIGCPPSVLWCFWIDVIRHHPSLCVVSGSTSFDIRYSKGHMVPPSVCNIFGSTSSVPPFRLPRFWINIIRYLPSLCVVSGSTSFGAPLLFEMLLDRHHSVPFFRFVIFLDRCHSVPPFRLRCFWTNLIQYPLLFLRFLGQRHLVIQYLPSVFVVSGSTSFCVLLPFVLFLDWRY